MWRDLWFGALGGALFSVGMMIAAGAVEGRFPLDIIGILGPFLLGIVSSAAAWAVKRAIARRQRHPAGT